MHPDRTVSLFCVVLGEFIVAKLCQLSELGDLGPSLLGGSHNSWGVRCVDKFLLGRRWRLDFAVGGSWREME